MSVKIRLHRAGQKHRPFYRVVVADSRSPRDGRFIETVGYYDPMPETTVLKLDTERVEHWMSKGATPSVTVKSLIKKQADLPTAADVAAKAREKRAKAVEEAARLAPRRPDPKPEAKDGGKPAPKAEAKGAPKDAPAKPAPKKADAPKAEAKPAAKPAPKAEAKPDAPKAEAPKPEAKPDGEKKAES